MNDFTDNNYGNDQAPRYPQPGNQPGAPLGVTDNSIAQAHDWLNQIRQTVQGTVIGQREVIDDLLTAVAAAGHVLVEGVPGLAKTLLVRSLSKTVDASFSRVQFTPDLMPSDIVGHAMFDATTQTFSIRRGPVFANFVIADEINRAPAKTQAALLEAMQEQQVSIEGDTLALPTPFVVMATQNPIEQDYPLPQAQLDRFLMKILIDYPEADDEITMLRMTTDGSIGDKLDISRVQTILQAADLHAIQTAASTIYVDDSVTNYIVEIVRNTRGWNGIETGAGPRASVALLRAARARALLQGRDFVAPDDVKTVALSVLRHRVALTADLEIEGYRVDDIVQDLLQQVAAPRQ